MCVRGWFPQAESRDSRSIEIDVTWEMDARFVDAYYAEMKRVGATHWADLDDAEQMMLGGGITQ